MPSEWDGPAGVASAKGLYRVKCLHWKPAHTHERQAQYSSKKGCIQQLSMQWAASMLPVSKCFQRCLLATYWADPVGGSPRGDRGVTARRVLGPRGSWDSAFMCDIVIDMPEVVRDGPIGVLDMDRGLSGLGATGCKVPKCLTFLSSSASNCRSMDPQSASRLLSLLLRYVSLSEGCSHKQPVQTGAWALAWL